MTSFDPYPTQPSHVPARIEISVDHPDNDQEVRNILHHFPLGVESITLTETDRMVHVSTDDIVKALRAAADDMEARAREAAAE